MRYPKPNHKTQQQRRRLALKAYKSARAEFLAEHPRCALCGERGTEIHHKRGRLGPLLTDKSNFLAVCLPCHERIEANPEWAYENGLKEPRL